MPADITNWREPEHNQWSFQNVDQILHTQTINAGSKAKELNYNLQDLTDFNLSRPDGHPQDLAAWLHATETDGLLVLHHDRVVYETYARTNTAASRHILMSLTKSVTGLLVGILASQGKLDVNAPVTAYVPEMQGTALRDATVRECLDMRSGVKYDDGTHEYRAAAGWNKFRGDEEAKSLRAFLSGFHAGSPPKAEGVEGWPFQYASVNTDLVGWILERVSGKTFAELVSELLWKPMGAESDALVAVDSEGSARAAGGMCVTLRDLARMGQLVLHDGDGIVPSDWIQDMMDGGSVEAFAAGPWAPRFRMHFESVSYRSFWVSGREEGVFMGLGIHGQMLFVDRKSKMVLAKTSSQPEAIDMEKVGLTVEGFKEVRRVLHGQ